MKTLSTYFSLPPFLSSSSSSATMAASSEELRQLVMIDMGESNSDSDEPILKFRIQDLARVSEGGTPILHNVCLNVPKGLIVGMIGPSGSGKSTILRALNRLWEPPTGTVFLDGYDICGVDVVTLRCKVGMLFQSPVLFEGSVRDNIMYGPHLRGKKLTEEEVMTLLMQADLQPFFATKHVSELSVGQAQRVALARTLANEPEVLLLDEPTSALDPISTQNVEDTIVKLKKGGLTTIIVSHSISQVQRIADIVCLVVDGEIVEVLEPQNLSQAKHPMTKTFLQLR